MIVTSSMDKPPMEISLRRAGYRIIGHQLTYGDRAVGVLDNGRILVAGLEFPEEKQLGSIANEHHIPVVTAGRYFC